MTQSAMLTIMFQLMHIRPESHWLSLFFLLLHGNEIIGNVLNTYDLRAFFMENVNEFRHFNIKMVGIYDEF